MGEPIQRGVELRSEGTQLYSREIKVTGMNGGRHATWVDDAPSWAELARSAEPGNALIARAARLYMTEYPDAELLEIPFGDTTFLFDNFSSADGREERSVAAWRIVPDHALPRDRTRQAGFPLHAHKLTAGYERGHLIARASGGPLDINLYPQAWQVNRGRSLEGKEFRRLEKLAARNPGCLQFSRLIWTGNSSIPAAHHLLIVIDGKTVQQGLFSNVPTARPSRLPAEAHSRMQAGTRFHRSVQADFLAGLAGADATPERTIRLMDNRYGRADLLVIPTGPERLGLVVEIKNTDFDALRPERVAPNVRRHLGQLQGYLDRVVEGIDSGDWDSTAGTLLYPSRPQTPGRAEVVGSIAARKSIMVVWRDECDW